MDIEIPQSSGSTLSVPLKCGDRLFMVGANGSGKSALIQHFVESLPRENIRRVTAHRQTWLQSGNVDLTPQGRKNIDEQTTQQELQSEARWTDQHGQQKLSAVLFDLVAKKNARNDTIAQHVDNQDCKAAVEVASQLVAPFDQMNELLALGTLMVSLELSGGEKITARHRHSNTPFSIAEMSDGERSAAIIAATVLTVEPGTVLLIDEPERHLHRAIIVPFLSALFEQRKDCTFIVSTHELALPIANPGAPILTIRSCDWEGDEVKAWDIVLLEAESELPEELKKAVLGARRRILFVEGNSSSPDMPLYTALFTDLSIEPIGSYVDVIRAVSGLRGSYELHHIEGFGLIDRDDRPDNAINRLAEKKVFALSVCSVEALYYCSDAIEAVAQQAKSSQLKADEMIKSAKREAINVLKQDCVAEEMAARRCERKVRNQILSKVPDWKSIKTDESPIPVDVPSPYCDELKRFRKLVSEENLDDLIARYPLHKSTVFDVIEKALKCDTRPEYQQMVLAQVQHDEIFADKLKLRINDLSKALESEMSNRAGSL